MLLIESPELILIFTIFFSIFLIFYVKFIRIMVPNNQIHIVKNKKNTMFFGKCIDRREYYYNFPTRIPVYGIEEKVVFRGGDCKISFDRVKHSNLYKESFESGIEILVKIVEPLKTIRFGKSYEGIMALLQRDLLIEINGEMEKIDGNEIIENPNEINSSIRKTIINLAERYGIQVLDVKVLDTTKTSKKAEIPEFELEKISLLGEKAPRMPV